jgi:hypothetical protein
MAVDRYTKFVLTVIAGCLLWICVAGVPSPLHAQQNTAFQIGNSPAVPVVIVGTGTLRHDGVVLVNYHGNVTDPTLPVTLPYTTTNPLPAHLTHTVDTPLPVEVSSVRQGASWSPLRVSVEDAPTRIKPGIGRGQ